MSEDIRMPLVSDELLDYLDRLYQDKCPELDMTEREIWMNRGSVAVVRHLRRIHKEQRENILGNIDDVRF